MEKLFAFVQANLGLSLLALILLFALLYIELKHNVRIRSVSAGRAARLMNQKEAVTLDTRAESAYKKGHIAGAEHFDASQDIEVLLEKLKGKEEAPIILVCQTGQSARQLGAKLLKKGFKEVSVLEGGIAQWEKDNLPLVSATKTPTKKSPSRKKKSS